MLYASLKSMPMNRVLALDLGLRTGWAIRTPGGAILSGVLDLRPKKDDGYGRPFRLFQAWLETLEPPHLVAWEEVRRKLWFDAAAMRYGGFQAILLAWCEKYDILYQPVGVSTIKLVICGTGTASKEEVSALIKAKGHEPEDDNESDALALLYTMIDVSQ